MKLAVGIDVHKEKCVACAVYAGQGEATSKQQYFLDRFEDGFKRFPSDGRGMLDMVRFLRGHELHVLIENSTKSHDIYWLLRALDVYVIVAHATDLYRITKSVRKNDDNDARELAGYMRRKLMGEVEFSVSHIPSHETLEKRELCRFDMNDRSELTAVKLQIRSHLLIRGMELSKKYSDITSISALDELTATKDTILMLDAKKAKELKLRILFTDRIIRQKMWNDRIFEIVWSIPGFGVLSAAYLACMADDMSRFDDGRAFAASFGLTPKLDESADKSKNCGISRRGDADMRRLIGQATFVHVTRAESFISEKYKRLRARGKHHNEALVACANSMVRMIFALIRDDRPYSADPESLAETRVYADSDALEDDMEAAGKD